MTIGRNEANLEKKSLLVIYYLYDIEQLKFFDP